MSDNLIPSVSCPDSTLAVGAHETCRASYLTTAEDVAVGHVTNTSTATGTPPVGPPVTSAPSSVRVPYVSLDVTASSSCVLNAPYFTYSASPVSHAVLRAHVTSRVGGPVTIVWENSEGVVVDTMINQPLSGTVLWPGAAVDAAGNGIAWPGWAVDAQGNWYQTTDALSLIRPVATVVITVGASTTVSVMYPPATPQCNANPAVSSSVTVVKSLAPSSPTSFTAPGETLSYDYVVTNTGTTTLSDVGVTDNLIAMVNCPESTLGPGLSETCTGSYLTTTDDVDAGHVTNTARATGSPPTGPPVVSQPVSLTVPGPAQEAGLSIVKELAPSSATSYTASGQTLTYDYVVTNTGNVTLTNISVTDNLIATVDCPQATLQSGDREICTANYVTTDADVTTGSVTNTAHATGSPPSGPPVTSSPSMVTVPAGLPTSLSLLKSTTTTAITDVGQVITYDYLVTDTGQSTISDVTVTDNKIPTSDITCPETTLGPGQSMTCTGTYTVTQADLTAGSITNVATATGSGPGGSGVSSNSSAATVGMPALQIVKTVNATTTAPEQVLTYKVTVTNTGTAPYGTASLPDAAFSDSLAGIASDGTYLPGSLTATAGTAAYSATSGIAWSGSLAIGAVATVTYQIRVKSPDDGRHLLTNTVVSSTPGSNCAAGTGSTTCSTRTPVADVSISKQVCGSEIAKACGPDGSGPWVQHTVIGYGAIAFWRIRVTNTGRVPVSGVSITDPAIPECAAAAGKFSLAVGATVTIYCSLADVTKGFTNIALVHFPAPPGSPGGSPPVTPSTGSATITVAQKSGSGGSGQQAPPAPPVTG